MRQKTLVLNVELDLSLSFILWFLTRPDGTTQQPLLKPVALDLDAATKVQQPAVVRGLSCQRRARLR